MLYVQRIHITFIDISHTSTQYGKCGSNIEMCREHRESLLSACVTLLIIAMQLDTVFHISEMSSIHDSLSPICIVDEMLFIMDLYILVFYLDNYVAIIAQFH